MTFGTPIRAMAVLAAALVGITLSIGTAATAATSAHEYPAIHTTRIAGADPYATSLAAADAGGAVATGGTVFLASGAGYSAASAAAPVAAKFDAPLLLTAPTALPTSVAKRLTALAPATIVVVGSTTVVSSAVLAAVHTAVPSATVTRVSGSDGFGTARAIVRWGMAHAASPFAPGVFVATAGSFPDALSAAAAAGARGEILVFSHTDATTLDSATMTLIRDLGVTQAHIAGGTGSVSSGIQTQLAAALGSSSAVTRLAGTDQYSTSVAIAKSAPAGATAFLASGSVYADALAGATAAARTKSPLLTVKTSCIPASVATYLHGTKASVSMLGSTTVLASTVTALVQCSTATYAVKSSHTVGALVTNGNSPNIALSAVSCPTTTRCVAVGNRTGRPIAAVETSGHWTVTSVPLPTGYTSPGSFDSVSCASATRCVAAGGFGTNERGLVEMFNGSTWTATRISAPAGAPSDAQIHLSAISCAGTSCAIAGTYSSYKTLLTESVAIDIVNSTVTTRIVPGHNELTQASCTASLSCTVGGIDSSAWLPLVGDPHAGQFTDAPAPANASGGFVGLVCSSPGECTGWTGFTTSSGVSNAGAILKQEDGVWTTDAIVPFSGTMSSFGARALSCATINFCATAFDASATNGSTWTPELAISSNHRAVTTRAPLPSGVRASMHPEIWKLACPRTGTCIAVGSYEASSTDVRMFVDVLSNGVWTAHGLPHPSGQKWVDQLDPSGISCPTTSTCHIVGTENYISTSTGKVYYAGFDDVIAF